ncbi:MAG TPA: putative Ig domain-containing protein, partial [Acidimicrobiales bacterium]|nr:putative Ig domain-containing protein [Acidimicrobiales bacterium]
VTLIVSEGPGDTVPPVVGENYLAAEQAIRKAGLNPQVTFKPSSPIRKNIVLHEAPPGGTQQAPGTTVTLTVGQGPLATVTVTNPGPQTSPANTAISGLQIVATDSASNPLTFSATGLPPGLSISATGMISGTPTTPGPYTVTVTATDTTTSATGTATFPWMVTPGGGGGGQVTPSRAQSPELTSAALRARRTVTAR